MENKKCQEQCVSCAIYKYRLRMQSPLRGRQTMKLTKRYLKSDYVLCIKALLSDESLKIIAIVNIMNIHISGTCLFLLFPQTSLKAICVKCKMSDLSTKASMCIAQSAIK